MLWFTEVCAWVMTASSCHVSCLCAPHILSWPILLHNLPFYTPAAFCPITHLSCSLPIPSYYPLVPICPISYPYHSVLLPTCSITSICLNLSCYPCVLLTCSTISFYPPVLSWSVLLPTSPGLSCYPPILLPTCPVLSCYPPVLFCPVTHLSCSVLLPTCPISHVDVW